MSETPDKYPETAQPKEPVEKSESMRDPDEQRKIDTAHKIKMEQLKELGITPPPSVSSVPHTFADVLNRVTAEAGIEDAQWQFPPEGAEFEKDRAKLEDELPKLTEIMKGAAGMGNAGCEKVNTFLRENGFSIQLEPSGRENSAYAASVLDVPFEWEKQGEKVDIHLTDDKGVELRTDGKNSPISVEGVKLSGGFEVMETPKGTPVLKIDTKGDETVYMVPAYGKNLPQDAVTLRRQIDSLKTKLTASSEKYDTAQFPMVDYSKSGEIAELKWAKIEGTDKYLDQAKYEHILKMNEFWGRAKWSAAVELRSRWFSIEPETKDLKITGSFLIWVEKNNTPVFQAQIQPDAMKKPLNLD
jgi:hypothetical protein